LIYIFIKKFKNTFLTPKYSSESLIKFYNNQNFFLRIISNILWFIPSSSQFRYWTNSEQFDHGYKKFIKMDNLSNKIMETVIKYSNKNDKILDICCNIGRVLNGLALKGYNNLYGFDINSTAIDNFKKEFKLDINVNITSDHAERYLTNQEDDKFDITYSLGASLELIPSHYDLVYHISRITKKYHICLINENGHAYPRFWRYEFKRYFSSCNCEIIANNRTLFILKK
jgi:SAM-dependent methyltransferase